MRTVEQKKPPRMISIIHVGLARPGRNAVLLAQLSAGKHLGTPHYVDMLRKAGLKVNAEDPFGGAREIVKKGVFAYGSPADVAERIREYHNSGVDEVVVNATGVFLAYGAGAALDDLREILAEFT